MAVYHADAIVIKSKEYGESDRLLTLFSREHGKIQAVAKGVRKPKSSQRAGSQLFTYSDLLIHKGKTLDTINQASPKESFRNLWDDFDSSMSATAICELLDAATITGQPHAEIFFLTLSSFFMLNDVDPQLVQVANALKLMTFLGYQPNLNQCVECGKESIGDRLAFSAEAGGLVCKECLGNYRHRWVKAGSVALMRQILKSDLKKVDRFRWNNWMKQEVVEITLNYCETQVGKPLRSWRMSRDLALDSKSTLNGGEANE